MTQSLEGWPTKAKEAPSPHEIRLALLDTNPVFQSIGEKSWGIAERPNQHLCSVRHFSVLIFNFFLI